MKSIFTVIFSLIFGANSLHSSPIDWFTSGFGAWSNPTDLSNSSHNSLQPQVSLDDSGDAVAIWSEWNGSNYLIMASNKTTSGWGPAQTISSSGHNCFDQQVSRNNSGKAIATWVSSDGSHLRVHAAVFDGVWLSPSTLSSANLSGEKVQLALNNNGAGIVLWREFNSNTNQYSLKSAEYTASSWSSAITVVNGVDGLTVPCLAISDADTAMVIYNKGEDGSSRVYACHYENGSWSSEVPLSPLGKNAVYCDIALNANGDGAAVWTSQLSGSKPIIRASTFDGTSKTWSLANDISSVAQWSYSPKVAINDSGKIMALWWDYSGIQSRYFNGTSCESIQLISGNGPNFRSQEIRLNNADEAVAVWEARNTSDIQSATFSSGSWSSSVNLNNGDYQSVNPCVDQNASGDSVCVWKSSKISVQGLIQASEEN